ncbi:MAG: hypothetical protein LYZ70_05585 [Nitrososphaerales archaeon]|nr:hypothetical protein [Nitrososphaerales archaeon]
MLWLMLHTKRRSNLVATASVFAGLFALLGAIPVSPYVVGPGYLPANKVVAPLAGMLFGPSAGGLSVVIGSLIDFAYKGQVRYDTLFADLAVTVTAALAYTGRRRAAFALPLLLLVWFSFDPLSVVLIQVAGVQVPFAWMHIISLAAFGAALLMESRGALGKLGPAFVGATSFASLMCGQIAGTLVGETLVRLNGAGGLTAEGWQGLMLLFFYRYPLERAFYTVAAVLVALPVLRSLSKMRKSTPIAS